MEDRVHWPGWEVVQQVGSGSFGAVYAIRRALFGDWEWAALKVISQPKDARELQQLCDEWGDMDSVRRYLDNRLQEIYREYSLMNSLKGNTNIVCCDDFRHQPKPDGIGWDIYIKMELLTPLTQYLQTGVSDEITIRVGMDICDALSLCKKRSIIHRDIKPHNIFVSRDGHFKLGDFGVAKISESVRPGTQIGTFRYMAPEVYYHRPYGPQADIYSLGLVLYWMLNRRRTPFLPLDGDVPGAETVSLADERRFRGEVLPPPANGSPQLHRIILKACAFDPKDRYSEPERMRRDLDALLKCSITVPAKQGIRPPVTGPHWHSPGDIL